MYNSLVSLWKYDFDNEQIMLKKVIQWCLSWEVYSVYIICKKHLLHKGLSEITFEKKNFY